MRTSRFLSILFLSLLAERAYAATTTAESGVDEVVGEVGSSLEAPAEEASVLAEQPQEASVSAEPDDPNAELAQKTKRSARLKSLLSNTLHFLNRHRLFAVVVIILLAIVAWNNKTNKELDAAIAEEIKPWGVKSKAPPVRVKRLESRRKERPSVSFEIIPEDEEEEGAEQELKKFMDEVLESSDEPTIKDGVVESGGLTDPTSPDSEPYGPPLSDPEEDPETEGERFRTGPLILKSKSWALRRSRFAPIDDDDVPQSKLSKVIRAVL
ncbi:hypothetical protein ACSSS7_005304 [Eimeria intestinalis]